MLRSNEAEEGLSMGHPDGVDEKQFSPLFQVREYSRCLRSAVDPTLPYPLSYYGPLMLPCCSRSMRYETTLATRWQSTLAGLAVTHTPS